MATDAYYPLWSWLPRERDADADVLLERFLRYVGEKGLSLYPAQEEAILEILSGKNLILSTPTGSGKSLVAVAMCFKAMAEDRRIFYTCPIKALVSEKFFALCDDLGPDRVGMLTGDAAVNRDAPVVCCTAEILANVALREGEDARVDYVVMDEFHYYADRERGVAWQIPLLALPQATFLLMSATMGPTRFFEECLKRLTGRPVAVVRSFERPVPLDYEYRDTPLHETVADLVAQDKAPIYIVSFTQRGAAEEAQSLMSTDYCTRDEKRAIAAALEGARFDSPYGKDIQRFIRHGIGLHHAGLLPKYRLLVEKLAQRGHLKVVCGTDTLGVGVNIPIRTVLFTRLCKYDGEKTAILSVRDFQQISGRAGRKGFDDRGTVVAQAPEHVIENIRLEQKALANPSKKRKIVRRKPPERGYVHWDRGTFDRLASSPPEPLVSRFSVSHGMILNVLMRPSGGCLAMKRLIRECHESKHDKRRHGRTAVMLFRSLVEAGIVEFVRPGEAHDGRRVRVNADLQEDFSLNHALSLFAVETIGRLDPESPDYALDLLTIVESILEDPDVILMRQLDRLKARRLAELKAAGVEYEERIAELEKLEHPKPNAELIYEAFDAFAKAHPWVGQENIRPKSVAREMYETYQSFSGYVREYGLERAEGLLLRYLSDTYKALVQTVPDPAKTDAVDEMIVYFRSLVRGVDSSLVDEWERLRGVGDSFVARAEAGGEDEGPTDVTRDRRRFTVLVRNEVFRLLRALASRDFEAAAAAIEPLAGSDGGEEGSEGGDDRAWTPDRLEKAIAPYFAEHAVIRTDPASRAPQNTLVEETPDGALWEVRQVLFDDEGATSWTLDCIVDLDRSRDEARAVVCLRAIRS